MRSRLVLPRIAPAAVLTVLAVLPGRALAEPCDCRHLEEVGAAWRNARAMQEAFRRKFDEYRPLPADQARERLREFNNAVDRGTVSVPGAVPRQGGRRVPYQSVGDTLTEAERAATPADRLCDASPAGMDALGQALQAERCDALQQAVVTHEQFHWDFCRRMGYTAYQAQHAADDVREEVEAYGAQAAILKAELERLLSLVNPRIVVTTHAVVVVPPAPYGSVTVDDRGEVRLGRLVGGADRVKIEGEGTQATRASVERSCRFDGLPLRIPARAVLETDGVDVAVDYRLSGVTGGFGMRCEIPGMGSGAGMSLPSPIQPTSGPLEVKLPLKNGAQKITDLAEGPGAQILAAAGMSLTGTGILELKYDCPTPP